jgi:hypothetical protein
MEIINYFFSPFVRPKLRFYFGKIAIGVPYFFPRRIVKDPQKPGYSKFVEKKFGFYFCRLGWKTKWTSSDYRFEWSPVFSFVCFKYQLAITVVTREPDHYWESWLFYHYSTDKSKSKKERVRQMITEFPQTYTRHHNGHKAEIDCYRTILKKKWRPLNPAENRDKDIDSILKKRFYF